MSPVKRGVILLPVLKVVQSNICFVAALESGQLLYKGLDAWPRVFEKVFNDYP